MNYMTRRNAATGWLMLAVGKYILRRKAKSHRTRWAAIGALVVAAVGVLVFWKKRSDPDLAGAGAPLPTVVPAVPGETGDDSAPDEPAVAGAPEQVDPKRKVRER